MRHRLYCPHPCCGEQAGYVEADRIVIRGRRGEHWDNDPVALYPLPYSTHCPHCRKPVWLNSPPRGPRVTLDPEQP
jgi:hypothetical protein